MKITPSKVKFFLEKPDALSGVLIYGSDSNKVDFYIKEIITCLTEHSIHVMDFTTVNKSPNLLLSELANFSLFSNKKLIKLINVHGNISKELRDILDHSVASHYIVMIASELAYNSLTKTYIENSKIFCAVPCYKDSNSNLYDIISSYLKQNGIKYTNELINCLHSYFNKSKIPVYPELEKLVLYIGKRKDLKLEDIESCFLTSGHDYVTLDNLCSTIANKDVASFIKFSNTLISQDNFSPIALIRIISNYFFRLESVLLLINSGMSEQSAIDNLNPPLFFKQLQYFKDHLKIFYPSELRKILTDLLNLEITCKKNNLDHKMLFQHKVSEMLLI